MPFLDTLVARLTDAVGAGGGSALFLVMLVENLFPPIPSEAVLPLAGFLVGQGELSLVAALVLSTLGSVVGAVLLYAIGRWGGRPVLLRWHRVLRLTEEQLDRADEWFDRRGPKLVFWFRMVPLARSVVSVPAGASEMPFLRFCLLTAAGSLIWNSILVGAGLALGRNWESVSRVAATYSDVVLLLIALTCVAGVVWLLARRRRSRPAG